MPVTRYLRLNEVKVHRKVLAFLTLFSSFTTLLCCAIPALLVTLGLGASFAVFLGNFPELIWLSEHKAEVFIFSGAMLTLSALAKWYSRTKSCPLDPKLTAACQETRGFSTALFYTSFGLYLVGAFFAFLAPYIFS